jgi:hypothetical protein
MSVQEVPVSSAVAEGFFVPQRRSSEQHDRLSRSSSRSAVKPRGFRAGMGLQNVARRTLGIFLLFVTVFLWTSSNFLASVSCHILHCKVKLTKTVHLRRQYIFEAILRNVYQYIFLRNLTCPDLPAPRTSEWLCSHQNINIGVLARADGWLQCY